MDQVTKQNKTAKKKIVSKLNSKPICEWERFYEGIWILKRFSSESPSLSFLIRFEIIKWKTKQKISDYRIYSIWLLKISMLLFFGGVGDYFDLNWLEKQTNNYHYVNIEQTNKKNNIGDQHHQFDCISMCVCVCWRKFLEKQANNFLVLN